MIKQSWQQGIHFSALHIAVCFSHKQLGLSRLPRRHMEGIVRAASYCLFWLICISYKEILDSVSCLLCVVSERVIYQLARNSNLIWPALASLKECLPSSSVGNVVVQNQGPKEFHLWNAIILSLFLSIYFVYMSDPFIFQNVYILTNRRPRYKLLFSTKHQCMCIDYYF